MSMLSAQIDELRATAEEIDWEFPFTASRLCDAADTIWQLRDDLQKANAENAKLRELCGELLDNLMPEICEKAHWCRDKDWHVCNDDACGNYTFVILARELGVDA